MSPLGPAPPERFRELEVLVFERHGIPLPADEKGGFESPPPPAGADGADGAGQRTMAATGIAVARVRLSTICLHFFGSVTQSL